MTYVLALLACMQAGDARELLAETRSSDREVAEAAGLEFLRILDTGSLEERRDLGSALLDQCNAAIADGLPHGFTLSFEIARLTQIVSSEPEALDPYCGELLDLYHNPALDVRARLQLLWVFGHMGPSAAAAEPVARELLEEHEQTDDRYAGVFYYAYAARVLFAISPEDEQAGSAIRSLLNAEDAQSRLLGCVILGWSHTSDPQWIPAVEELLSDEAPAVRVSAANSYYRLTNELEPALSILVASLKEDPTSYLLLPKMGMSSIEDGHQENALYAIGHIGPPAETCALELCQHFRSRERLGMPLHYALVRIAPESEEVIATLEPMLDELEERQRAFAEYTIEEILANIAARSEQQE